MFIRSKNYFFFIVFAIAISCVGKNKKVTPRLNTICASYDAATGVCVEPVIDQTGATALVEESAESLPYVSGITDDLDLEQVEVTASCFDNRLCRPDQIKNSPESLELVFYVKYMCSDEEEINWISTLSNDSRHDMPHGFLYTCRENDLDVQDLDSNAVNMYGAFSDSDGENYEFASSPLRLTKDIVKKGWLCVTIDSLNDEVSIRLHVGACATAPDAPRRLQLNFCSTDLAEERNDDCSNQP